MRTCTASSPATLHTEWWLSRVETWKSWLRGRPCTRKESLIHRRSAPTWTTKRSLPCSSRSTMTILTTAFKEKSQEKSSQALPVRSQWTEASITWPPRSISKTLIESSRPSWWLQGTQINPTLISKFWCSGKNRFTWMQTRVSVDFACPMKSPRSLYNWDLVRTWVCWWLMTPWPQPPCSRQNLKMMEDQALRAV